MMIFVRDHLRRSRPRVQIAKAAITGDHVWDAFFYRAVLAVPVHGTCPDVYYCAPTRPRLPVLNATELRIGGDCRKLPMNF
jgi:hypothetical protein